MASPALPQLHIRPDHGWLNDPNGMVHHRGRWHVFFQHNPHAPVHDHIAWGHVSSGDLVRWDPHPVAFAPEPGGPDRAGCWSGVFLPWLDRPAVAYSGVVDNSHASTVVVREALDDDLLTWGAPYVVAATPPDVTQMRDPFCFEFDGQQFALLGARVGSATPAVLLFSCANPRAWRYEGVWLTGDDPGASQLPPADFWECPQLVEVDGRSVLVLSLQRDGQLASVAYLLGEVAATAGLPRFSPSGSGRLDEGPACYAPQVALDPEGPWLLGWVLDVSRPEAPPTAVSGCLTLPRRLKVVGDAVVSRVDRRLGAYADSRPVSDLTPAQLAAGVRLPRLARLIGRGAGSDSTLILAGIEHEAEIAVGAAGFEVWCDADVVEVYREQLPPVTLRQAGTSRWVLRLATPGGHGARLTAVAPPTPGAPVATQAAGAGAAGR